MSSLTSADFSIDHFALDKELISLPALVYSAATKVAESRAYLDDTTRLLELHVADLDNQIRQDPVQFGLTKLTETTVAMTVERHPETQVCKDRVNQAKLAMSLAMAAVSALDCKKKALDNLVSLRSIHYFSDT